MSAVTRRLIPIAVALTQVPAIAQETLLEEVVVTARKRVENLQEVPLSITTTSGNELAKLGVVKFDNIEYANPNVRILPSSSSGALGSMIAIRGNLQNDSTTQLDPAVGTYLDGMLLSRTFGVSASMVDLQSVQTLKGPQGTLFGRNATGGAILLTTTDPALEDGISGYIKGEVGNEDIAGVEGALNLPLGSDVALRLVAHHREWGDYIEYNDGTKLGGSETENIRAKLLWQLNNATTIKLTAEHAEVEATDASQLGVQPNDANFTGLDNISGVFPTPLIPGVSTGNDIITPQVAPQVSEGDDPKAETRIFVLDVEHETSLGELKFVSGYREVDLESTTTLPPGLGWTRQDKPDLENFTAELQFNGLFLDEKLELTSGLYYFDETTHEDQETFTFDEIREEISIFPEVVSRTITEAESESWSAFVQGNYAITDRARLTLGGRYTSDEREMEGTQGSLGAPGDFLTYDYDDSDFNYLVSLDYVFSDDVMGYVNTATGYRSGGAALSPDENDPTRWGSFDPEEVTNYEAGLKSEWLNNRLRINAAVYHQDYTDYQYTAVSVATGVPVRVAVTTDATISGGELELNALLPAEFFINLTYGYTKGEIDGGEADGDPLSNIPENTFSATLGKVLSTNFGEFDFRVLYNYTDDYYAQVGFQEESAVDERDLVNLSATYTNGPWSVVGYVNNALDDEYYNGFVYSPSSPQAFGLFGLSFTQIGLPRMAGVKVGYEF